jgi:hypothetical protein
MATGLVRRATLIVAVSVELAAILAVTLVYLYRSRYPPLYFRGVQGKLKAVLISQLCYNIFSVPALVLGTEHRGASDAVAWLDSHRIGKSEPTLPAFECV